MCGQPPSDPIDQFSYSVECYFNDKGQFCLYDLEAGLYSVPIPMSQVDSVSMDTKMAQDFLVLLDKFHIGNDSWELYGYVTSFEQFLRKNGTEWYSFDFVEPEDFDEENGQFSDSFFVSLTCNWKCEECSATKNCQYDETTCIFEAGDFHKIRKMYLAGELP